VLDMDTPGVSTKDVKHKLGQWACPLGEIIFEDVRIPAGNRLGAEGKGFIYLLQTLVNTRLSAAAGAVGTCQAAVDAAVKYASTRHQFGKSIAEFQMVKEVI